MAASSQELEPPQNPGRFKTLDATELVVNYLKTHTANPELNRVNLISPLPVPVYSNRE